MQTENLASLRTSHPAWVIWQSNAGAYYATRYLAPTDARSGKVATLAADDLGELAARLTECRAAEELPGAPWRVSA